MMEKKKGEPQRRPPWVAIVGWDKAALFAAATLAVGVQLWRDRGPLERTAVRLLEFATRSDRLTARPPLHALSQRIARRASPEHVRLSWLKRAFQAAETGDGSPASAADALDLLARAASSDANNAVYDILKTFTLLGLEPSSADPAHRFAVIRPHLEASAGKVVDLGTATERRLWEAVFREEHGDPSLAVLMARALVQPRHLEHQRRVHRRLFALADELAGSRPAEAAVCCAAVVAWAGAASRATSDTHEALFWAEKAAEAYGRLSLLQARAGRHEDAAASRRAQLRGRQFLEVLASRLAGETVYLDELGRGRVSTGRRQPFLAMMSYLVTSAILLLAAGAALTAGVVGLAGAAWCALRRGGRPDSAVALDGGIWSWCCLAALLLVPPLLICAGLLLMPIDAELLQAPGWLTPVFGLAALGTAALSWISGRYLAARKQAAGVRGSLVEVFAALAAAGVTALLFLPWGLFGRHPEWFERSWRLSAAVSRSASVLLWLVIVLVLGGVAAGAAALVRRVRSRGGELASPPLAFATCKTSAVASMLTCLCCAALAAGSLRICRSYEAVFYRLAATDAGDEVAARLGPGWRTAFFPADDTLLRESLSRLVRPADR